MSLSLTIRHALPLDNLEVPITSRCWVAEVDGRRIGLWGLFWRQERWLFAELSEELLARPLLLVREGRRVMRDLASDGTFITYADPSIPQSGRLLEALGFQAENHNIYRYTDELI